MNLIDPKSSIIRRLHTNNCFNEHHEEYIECSDRKLKKVRRLLSIVRRRSVASFNMLVVELCTDQQYDAAKLLDERGGKSYKHEILHNQTVV